MDLGEAAVSGWAAGCVKAARWDTGNLWPEAAEDPQRSRDAAETERRP